MVAGCACIYAKVLTYGIAAEESPTPKLFKVLDMNAMPSPLGHNFLNPPQFITANHFSGHMPLADHPSSIQQPTNLAMFSSPISLTTAARLLSAAFLACIAGVVSAQAPVTQQLLHTSDANSTIHKLELIHLFQDEWPTGITVSSSGRMFANYPRSDPNNTAYTVAELMGNSTERAYPSVKFNMPASGIVETDAVSGTMVGSGDSGALISVQSVVLDPMDRLWILDTGMVLDLA